MQPLQSLRLDPETLRLIAELDEFKGRWSALGALAPDRLRALKRIATIESVGSSTRIEGASLSDAEVDALLSRVDVQAHRSRDEAAVGGYADAMELVFEAWRELPLTENHVKQIHGVLLRHVEKDARHRGHYRTLPNRIEAFDADGKSLGVIFATASPFETPRLMERLVQWTRGSLEAREHHPLLVIAAFAVRFLAIHPFQDGNGRLSRILTTLLLLRAGYEHVPYASLERVIEESREGYYRALRAAQSTLDGDESRLGDWVSFFLRCLVRQKDTLATRIERERQMAPLPPLSARILELVREHGRLTIAAAVELLGAANRNTVKAHLRRLVAAERLVQRGRGRGTWYERGSD